MIIKSKTKKDFVVLEPATDFVSLHEFNPSPFTEIRITTIYYAPNKPFYTVNIATLSERKWDLYNYYSEEVYEENYKKILDFIRYTNTDTEAVTD